MDYEKEAHDLTQLETTVSSDTGLRLHRLPRPTIFVVPNSLGKVGR